MRKGADNVGHKPVLRPVAPSNDIAGSYGNQGHLMLIIIFSVKKGSSVSGSYQFSRSLAGTVWVITTHRVIFTISVIPLFIFITFIARNIDTDPNRSCFSNGL